MGLFLTILLLLFKASLSAYPQLSPLPVSEESSEEESIPEVLPVEEVAAWPPPSMEHPIITEPKIDRPFLLEGKVALFAPTDHTVRQIYTSATGMYGIEASARAWKDFYPWLSGSYLASNGSSIEMGNPSKVTVVPIGAGLKWFHHANKASFYVGVGALYSYIHVEDHSPYVKPSFSAWDGVGIVKVGACIFPIRSLFFDFFADYSYMKFDLHGCGKKTVCQDVNFSGFSFGVSIGWAL
ncbi:MAG: hypothetical protein JSS61_06180 [Verrucomicrobia bacterium]|nr:hypothetical protein [Verrucomicrobiota bacterium]